MPNYQLGKIYRIEQKVGGGECYVGSTTKKYLAQRWNDHKQQYKQWQAGKIRKISSFDLFDKYDAENCQIILIENHPCNTKDELRMREDHWIKNTPNCVNIQPAVADPENKKECTRRYRCTQKYRDHLKNYRQRDHVKQYQNEYAQSEKRKAYEKQYYERRKNNEKYKELMKKAQSKRLETKLQCGCGTVYSNAHKNRHMQTRKHREWVFRNDEANYLFAINI